MRAGKYAVQATVSPAGTPQAAVVGIVVTDALDVVFDTLATSRKAANLRRNPTMALVVGGCDDETAATLQIEGVVDEPSGRELAELQELYFEHFPDGRDRLRGGGITYVRVRPTWMRYSNFATDPPEIIEYTPATVSWLTGPSG